MTDQRMLWIRNLDNLCANAAWAVEAELGSELHIPGFLDYENGALLCGLITHRPDRAGLYKYLLRLRSPGPVEVDDTQLRAKNPRGYVFRDGPIGEVVALLSFRLQARFFLLSTAARGLSPYDFPARTESTILQGRVGRNLDSVVFSDAPRNLTIDLPQFLDEVRLIPAKQHLETVVAANHYARALREIGIDEEMVFVRLVSAIERVSAKQPIPDDPLCGQSPDTFVGLDRLSPEQREEFDTMFRARRKKARFIAFLHEYSAGFWNDEPREPAFTHVTRESLAAVAAAVYDARSGYLHDGDPMYLSLGIGSSPGWHMDSSGDMIEQDRYFREKQKLPRADFFHRLVRHCLLARIKRLVQVNGATTPPLGHDSSEAD